MRFLRLNNKVMLAPMAGITNLPFRLLCLEYGAAAVFTEMISADALAMESRSSLSFAQTDAIENPVGLQLFSSNADNLVKAAEIMQKDFDFIDINMGCSIAKVLKQQAGAYLLKNPAKVAQIITKVSDAIDIPLTIKIRSGFNSVNAVEIAQIAENNGAAAVTIHPRTAMQGFSGDADWDIIKKVKENINIPVIGNGDIREAPDAEGMFDKTGCDFIMIGRAARGNPFIFRQVNKYLANKTMIEQNSNQKINDFIRYAKLAEKFDMLSLNDLKTKAQQFTRTLPDSCRMRQEIAKINDINKIKELIKSLD
ncbi:MAG: tRNA dihydrouridine synthase DusB [Nanoarchaeota archaeon]|nr:tRNA dihydrouridine synthase DusB [Nanoarchaeota archaeon]